MPLTILHRAAIKFVGESKIMGKQTLIRSFQATIQQRLSSFTPLIQVICGPRQVGKTTAVREFLKDYPANSRYLTFDNPGRDPELPHGPRHRRGFLMTVNLNTAILSS